MDAVRAGHCRFLLQVLAHHFFPFWLNDKKVRRSVEREDLFEDCCLNQSQHDEAACRAKDRAAVAKCLLETIEEGVRHLHHSSTQTKDQPSSACQSAVFTSQMHFIRTDVFVGRCGQTHSPVCRQTSPIAPVDTSKVEKKKNCSPSISRNWRLEKANHDSLFLG